MVPVLLLFQMCWQLVFANDAAINVRSGAIRTDFLEGQLFANERLLA